MPNAEQLSDNQLFHHDPIVKMEQPHEDARGGIQPLVNEEMKSAVMISSKKGTVRANHFHKTDWHYCYVLSGTIDYYWRPVNNREKPRHLRIAKGHLFFTPPLIEHAMVFAEDTVFLCLGRNPRDQETYETDIERVQVYPF